MHHLGYYLARASVAVVAVGGGAGWRGHVGTVLRNEQRTSLQVVVPFVFLLCSYPSVLRKERRGRDTRLRYDDFGTC